MGNIFAAIFLENHYILDADAKLTGQIDAGFCGGDHVHFHYPVSCGAAAGGFMLFLLTLLLITALRKDMAFTNEMDLPMLAYAAKISPIANIAFGTVLFAAIYSAATSTYYGFSTKIKDGPKKKYILIAGALIGFFCGLAGFNTIVAYLYPAEGYIGIVILLSIVANFIKTWRENRGKNDNDDE